MKTPTPTGDVPLDLLCASAEHRVELRASSADVRVVITGEHFFTGDAALARAKEVAQFVAAVRAAGVEEADVHLEAASVRTAKGLLIRSSGAEYTLLVHCRKLDSLADVIGGLGGLKDARLAGVRWQYNDSEEVRIGWLEVAARLARIKADRAAAALGVRVVALHRFEERVDDPEQDLSLSPPQEGYGVMARAKRESAPDFGVSLTHTKRVAVRVNAQFRVGPV